MQFNHAMQYNNCHNRFWQPWLPSTNYHPVFGKLSNVTLFFIVTSMHEYEGNYLNHDIRINILWSYQVIQLIIALS